MLTLKVGFALFCLVCCQSLGHAQTQGEITGEIADSSGAVMPGVAVVVTNENTNL